MDGEFGRKGSCVGCGAVTFSWRDSRTTKSSQDSFTGPRIELGTSRIRSWIACLVILNLMLLIVDGEYKSWARVLFSSSYSYFLSLSIPTVWIDSLKWFGCETHQLYVLLEIPVYLCLVLVRLLHFIRSAHRNSYLVCRERALPAWREADPIWFRGELVELYLRSPFVFVA